MPDGKGRTTLEKIPGVGSFIKCFYTLSSLSLLCMFFFKVFVADNYHYYYHFKVTVTEEEEHPSRHLSLALRFNPS